MRKVFAVAGLSVALLGVTGATTLAVGGQVGSPAKTTVVRVTTVLAGEPECPDPTLSPCGCCTEPTS